MYCGPERGWVPQLVWGFEMAAVHVSLALFYIFSFFISRLKMRPGAGERRVSEFALKQSRMAVRVGHGWDVSTHSLLESCLSIRLPIRPTPSLPILIWTSKLLHMVQVLFVLCGASSSI